MKFVAFMASDIGRWLRIGAGALMLLAGWLVHGTAGAVIAAFGLMPLIAGTFDLCLLGPAFGLPIGGFDIRKRLAH